MNIELSVLRDDRVLLVSDRPMPAIVKRVEFYREQRLFMLVFTDGAEQKDLLMHYEVPQRMVYSIEKSPDILLYTMFPDYPPIGYKAPLIKVGNIS